MLILLPLLGAFGAPEAQDKAVLSNPHRTGRSMVMSRHGIVAAEHPFASQAGIDMLRRGGSAMDAAVAAAAVLGVVQPMMTGLGGDVWMLYYEAATGEVHALNGSGHSPQRLTREHFRQKDRESIDDHSWEAVTVPGTVDGWWTGHQRFGRVPWAEVMQPAIRYAQEGFPVTQVVHEAWQSQQYALRNDEWARKLYLIENEAPALGSVFRNPYLAETLMLIARGGRDAFYRGPVGQEIVKYAQATGGFLTNADFEQHRSDWVKPISVNYRGYDVYQCPPNGQGMGVLLMLNILEGFDLPALQRDSPAYWHLLVEAKKLAYADLHKFVADPDQAKVPVEALLSKGYAAERRKLIHPFKAMPEADPGIPKTGDTVYLTVVDESGNACSLINSLYGAFGSGIVGGSTGIMMQNRGSGFSLEAGHFNEYAPGKRPYHTIIPGMVLKDAKLYWSFGCMGGDMQPQGQVQILLNHIDHGLNIQEAIDAPRWRHMKGLELRVEEGTPDHLREGLGKLGHDVREAPYISFGGSQIVMVDTDTGTYLGASDPRKDGHAVGY
jgi:gamma-glutamyltranspeptidase/glutathione hydrolase